MTDLNEVREHLDQATACLDDLRIAMREGQEVDLSAFNYLVALTCKAAVELPQADAPKVRPQLERLLNGLSEAKTDIEAEQVAIDARLTELGPIGDMPTDITPPDAAETDPEASSTGTSNDS